jgi:folylpolyglutamate synthase/dihydropteroate synthase
MPAGDGVRRRDDDAILVTGSLYTAGAARPVLQRSAN